MNKSVLEQFRDIKNMTVCDGPEITVEDITPHRCEVIEKALQRLEVLESYLVRWNDLLKIDGINSKSMVLNDIQYLLKGDEKNGNTK